MKNKKKLKKIIITVVAIIAVIFILVKIFGGKKTVLYKTELPKISRITEKVEAAGKINPVTQTSVGTQVSGSLQELNVDYNSIVKKGDIMAVIDPSTYESAVLQQEANLERVDSVFKNAKRNYERYQKLYKEALVAKSELDNAEVDYLSAQAQVVQAKASLDKAKIDLGYTKIVSPVNGIVISKQVELGQTVAASFQTPTLFLVAEDLTKMQIEVNISEADISKIKEGQDVEFSVDAYPDVTFKGAVKQVRNSPTTIQNVVTYTVVVAVDNKDLKLKPGMTANASIITARKKDILTVSNQALRFVPPTDAKIKNTELTQETAPQQNNNGGYNRASAQNQRRSYKGQGVWTENRDGSLTRIEIKTGITDGLKTELTESDLTETTPIITSVESAGATQKSNQMRMPRF
ncbi:MAG: efflux RND transporter periplasmic adaptor subunit [Elusimicrobiota bacterium]|jgi:HlyD family secretion protein|nr:efflux RND transporter periplasmic adaptor subunit [Elusimicrobiota bacterium]